MKRNIRRLLILLYSFSVFFGLKVLIYADEPLPSYFIRLPANENIILVEKHSQTLFLYSHKQDGIFFEMRMPCSTGGAHGPKKKAGDKKTPEGVYFLKDEYEDRYLSPIYGKKAFPTDYPNFIDRRYGRKGYAIWIHGTNKRLKPMDSNGCIALKNDDILKLSDYIDLNSTPVVLVERIERTDRKDLSAQRDEIFMMLDRWADAIGEGGYEEYISFYCSDCIPGIRWESWLALRNRAEKLRLSLRPASSNIGIYKHNGMFVILFDYCLVSEKGEIRIGKKKLFIEKKDYEYKIIGDLFQSVARPYKKVDTPLIAAVERIVEDTEREEVIIGVIYEWISAWSSKDMNRYISFYADNFYSDGMNKKEWIERKKELSKKNDYINIFGRDFKIKYKDNDCEVSFFQVYESSGFKTQGIKRLKFVKKGGLWKIYQERWSYR